MSLLLPALLAGTASAPLLVGLALALWAAPWRAAEAPSNAVRFEVGPSAGMTFNQGAYVTLSPDGRWMVFQANGEDGVTRGSARSMAWNCAR